MVKYIEYKGGKYPIRIAYKAMKGFKKDTGVSFTDIKGNFDISMYESLLYHALISGCKVEEIEMPFQKDQMEDVLDACFMEFMDFIPEFFPKSSKVKQLIQPSKQGNVEPDQTEQKEEQK